MMDDEKLISVRCSLRNPKECAFELAKIIRMARAGRLETSDMCRYANAIQVLSKILETTDLQQRLEVLESKQ